MNIFVTLNDNYIPQLSVMLTSLYINNPEESFNIFLAHKNINEKKLKNIEKVLDKMGYSLFPIMVNDERFLELPSDRLHPQEMYYKLFASELLPKNLDKALYLDPDLLVINPLRPLYEIDMGSKAFAAASHSQKTTFLQQSPRAPYLNVSSNNSAYTIGFNYQKGKSQVHPNQNTSFSSYNLEKNPASKDYNSGVVLINLPIARRETDSDSILKFVKTYSGKLAAPDSDVLGLMYGNKVISIDSLIWNYNAKNYTDYLSESENLIDTVWIMKNTSIIHFCGNNKPWKDIYRHRFGLLYKHYMQIASRLFNN